MTLTPGTRVGPYEVLASIGSGGMGEVYRAHDSRLNRDVALKVLPELFVLDHERVIRFKREAQMLGSLNHPNIAAIYGFEESIPSTSSGPNVHALVLELVEGPTLADRIAQGAIPLDEALPIARQIAEALEAAHEQRIVHRDLKPANIKLRSDDTVKVLDFGLAKAIEPSSLSAVGSTSPTITSPAVTERGVILGTAPYMSPEQARGRPADQRSDVWAFGAVVYEMLSGRRAFKGDDLSDTLAAVLRQDVDWSALPASTPAAIRHLLARCLDRDQRRRLRDIGEARIVLENPSSIATEVPKIDSTRTPASPWRRAIPIALAAVIGGALIGTVVWYFREKPPAPNVTRFSFLLADGQTFSGNSSLRHLIAISPDGTQVVYKTTPSQMFVRSMSDPVAKPIKGTEAFQIVTEPVFSPDGGSVAFFVSSDQTVKRIPVTGGAAVTICPAEGPYGMSWGPHGILIGQGNKGIIRVSENGGQPETLVRVKDDEEAHGPQMLPDGKHVLFTLATGAGLDRWDKARIVVQSTTSTERKTLIEGGTDARYLPTGHIIYALGGSLFAVAFDAQKLAVKGNAVPIVEGVRQGSGAVTGASHYSVSDTGSLIYVPGAISTVSTFPELVLADRTGAIERLNLPAGPYLTPRMSPDGSRVAFATDDGKEAVIWIYDMAGTTTKRRLTFAGNNRIPIWSVDGKRIAFQSDRDGDAAIFWQSADGGTAERLTKPNAGESHAPESWSPKGDILLFSVRKGSEESLSTLSMPDRKVAPFDDVRSGVLTGALFSPDGRWVTYASGGSDDTTVYVQPFPANGTKYQLPAKEGDVPHMAAWSADMKELFYDPRAGGFEAVAITTQPAFAFGNPVEVPHKFQLGPRTVRRTYDLTRSGKFLSLIPAGLGEFFSPITPEIRVVLNWFEELKVRVPGGR